jgi:hypothetical protein
MSTQRDALERFLQQGKGGFHRSGDYAAAPSYKNLLKEHEAREQFTRYQKCGGGRRRLPHVPRD